MIAVTYLGDNADETEIMSEEIIINPFCIANLSLLSMEKTPIGGGVIIDMFFNENIKGHVNGKCFYRKTGTVPFESMEINTEYSYNTGLSFVLNDLMDEQAYEFYVKLNCGDEVKYIGSENDLKSFTTGKNKIYSTNDFKDANFYYYLLKEYGKTDGDISNLTDIDLNEVTRINYHQPTGDKAVLKALNGIENLKFLHEAYFEYNNISEINGIEKLKYLTDIELCFNNLKDIPDCSSLVYLDNLNLEGNELTSSTLLKNKLPDGISEDIDEYITMTLSKQMGIAPVNMKYPESIYLNDDKWPFMARCTDKEEKSLLKWYWVDYGISITGNGITVSSEYKQNNDTCIWVIPDLKQAGIPLKLGENNLVLSVSDKYGHIYFEENIIVNYLEDDDCIFEKKKISAEKDYIIVDGNIKGKISKDDISDVRLFKNDNTTYKIEAEWFQTKSYECDRRYSDFATLYIDTGKEAWDYEEVDINELIRENTDLRIKIDFEEKLTPGKYNLKFKACDKEMCVFNIIEVFSQEQAIILDSANDKWDYDLQGDYFYFYIDGTGPIPDYVWPIIGSKEKPLTGNAVEVIPYSMNSYLYKLPKIKGKWDPLVPGIKYNFKLTFGKKDADVLIIDNTDMDSKFFSCEYKVDRIISYDYYNEKKNSMIACVTSYVPDGTSVLLEIKRESDKSKVSLQSPIAIVKNGLLEYRLISENGEELQISEGEELKLCYSVAAEPLNKTYYSEIYKYGGSYYSSSDTITHKESEIEGSDIESICIFRPVSFEPVRTIKVDDGQKKYYFTKEDLTGLDLNEVYEVIALDKNGAPISYRSKGFLEVKKGEDNSSSIGKSSSSSVKKEGSSSGMKNSSSSIKKDDSSSDKKGGSSSTFPVTPDPYIPVKLDSDNMQHIEVKTGIKNIDGSSDILSIDTVKYVAYNGKKHVSPFDKVSKSAVGDVVVNVHGNITKDGTIKLKFKNNKTAWVSGRDNTESKRPYFILSFKPDKGIDKETKQQIKLVNASLKNKPVYFDIQPIDISKGEISIKTDKLKSKVTKAEISIDGKTYKLSKKDYDIKFTEGEYVIITGKRNFTGTKMAKK